MSSSFEIKAVSKENSKIDINLFYLTTTPARELFEEHERFYTEDKCIELTLEDFNLLKLYYIDKINENINLIKIYQNEINLNKTVMEKTPSLEVFKHLEDNINDDETAIRGCKEEISGYKNNLNILEYCIEPLFTDELICEKWKFEYFGG